MLRKMQAEILFLNPNDLNPATAELVKLGFDVEFLDDWIDDEGPAVWIVAWTLTELDQSSFFDWVKGIVELVGGDVVEAGDVQSPREDGPSSTNSRSSLRAWRCTH
jgi:hypothetical protein